jgi:hypothetical protein
MPKVIDPKLHAIIDYAVAGTFLAMGALFLKRGAKRAAISSFICGGATAVTSMMTDYPGGVVRKISFPTHGRIDMGLAAITASLPGFMGFDDDAEERFFTVQSLAETGVVGMTDFDQSKAHQEYQGLAA